MKFRPVKRLADTEPNKVVEWLRTELNGILRELFIGLGFLTFADNFQSFEWEGSIVAGAEQQIVHNLKAIPTRFFVLGSSNTNAIVKGDSVATAEVFYVKNLATTSTFEGKVLILL